jgi:hypothetical protein
MRAQYKLSMSTASVSSSKSIHSRRRPNPHRRQPASEALPEAQSTASLSVRSNAVAGACAGTVVSLCLHPIDTVKTVIQVRPKPPKLTRELGLKTFDLSLALMERVSLFHET